MIKTIVFLMLCLGYILNLYGIAVAHEVTGMVVLRIIGIFAWPIGCVLGYI